jgi:hypothetical protein
MRAAMISLIRLFLGNGHYGRQLPPESTPVSP